MEITHIKQHLSILTVLKHYGLTPDRNKRIHCPFHEDKTPSMQVYPETGTVYCFSSNCKTRGKSIDQIDFIMLSEAKTRPAVPGYNTKQQKHEAIEKAKSMLNYLAPSGGQKQPAPQEPGTDTEILNKIFNYFRNGFIMRKDNKARNYLQGRNLDISKLENLGITIGYNSAQFHHRGRISPEDMQACETAGLLIKSSNGSRTEFSYTPWASFCAIFPLTDEKGSITGMYGRATRDNTKNKHYYLKNGKGLFYRPKDNTKQLIITESIIDFLSLYQTDEIRGRYGFLPIYGTNRLNGEHKAAIKKLGRLQEIIFFLDGDKAGDEAADKYGRELHELLPHTRISKVSAPAGEDINSLLDGREPGIFTHLLNQRTELFFSNEPPLTETAEEPKETNEPKEPGYTASEEPKEPETEDCELNPEEPKETEYTASEKPKRLKAEGCQLVTTNPHNLKYPGNSADYYVKGGLRGNLDSLKVSLQIVNRETRSDHRSKADLYEHKPVENLVKTASEQLNIPAEDIRKDLSKLTRLLEQYRNKTMAEQNNNHKRKPAKQIPPATINQCLDILKSENPIKRINELIGKSGVTGEENNRIFLFGIASSYKMPDTLHALIQGSSGSGKTMLLKTVYDLMPDEDTTKFTRVTDSSFYNYREHYFVNRLVCFEDIDGLKEDALYAVRELISNEILVSSTSIKNEHGEITGAEKTVRGPIASISCTTKGEIYEDNMSRVFLIAVDESEAQTKRVIRYQQQKASGTINRKEEKQIKELLQNCIRLLKPYEVVNPYASKIQLPEEAHKIRRLNDLYLSFVRQVTLINQYKRKKDKQGRLITEPEDLQTANEIMFDSIVLKVDELDGSLRGFYEKLKSYVQEKEKDYAFNQREIRQAFRISKTGCQNYINTLLELEYIHKTYVGQRNTFHYKISHWDSLEALRERIRTYLDNQLKTISDQN